MIRVWTVTEIQLDGLTPATVSYVFTDEAEAIARFFQVCAAAAQSGLDYHAVALIPDNRIPPGDTRLAYWQIFDRRGQNG